MPQSIRGVVLVADGEAAIRDMLLFYLKRSGYQVIQAEDGQDALIEMTRVRPDLILADLPLPEIPGDQLCKMVKGSSETREIYFILMIPTDSEAGIDVTVDALSVGADDTISKPLRSQEMLARVESAFRIIEMQKEIKLQNRELTIYREKVQGEMELASRLQMSLLPDVGTIAPYQYTHRYQPVGGIGGDIYAITPLPYGGVALLIADVSGHGVTAALISAIVKTSFEYHIRGRGGPLAWAQSMNRDLKRNTMDEQFATALLAKFDPAAGTLTYVCAGHVPPIYVPSGVSGATENSTPAAPIALGGGSPPLGMDEGMSFAEHTIDFALGDRLVLYTDGLVESESESGNNLGSEGLLQCCSALPADLEDAASQLFLRAREFIEPNEFADDVTLVVVDYLK
ncbi:MAG: fused response regulator/phosphatase [Holophagales bacterium]|nr:fused response regulator/phosphatase [Holophagales bacterium]